MPYNKLLNKLIDESGLQIKEIAEKCKALGEDITPSYISLLKNNPNRIPSEKISKVIAKACGAKYENSLVIEGYIDNAPKEINDFFIIMKSSIIATMSMSRDNNIPNDVFAKILQSFEEMPIADFICMAIENPEAIQIDKTFNGENSAVTIKGVNTNVSVTMNEPEGIKMQDDSMYPIIPKNSMVMLNVDSEIFNGDIVCYKSPTNNQLIIRRYMPIDEKKIAFVPVNNGFDSEILDKDNAFILGKVSRVITKF